MILKVPETATFDPGSNIIVGNVALYGATSGRAFINGIAGERFAVRNSGVQAVVEGVGDHGCEYMTGGRIVILGQTGRNFAAGMSGGIAYIYDEHGIFAEKRCNLEMVELERLEDSEEIAEVTQLVEEHVRFTGSEKGRQLLYNWETALSHFVKVIPTEYKRALARLESQGLKAGTTQGTPQHLAA